MGELEGPCVAAVGGAVGLVVDLGSSLDVGSPGGVFADCVSSVGSVVAGSFLCNT